MWTKFWDMNSGGVRKEKWDLIFIEAPIDEAELIFFNRFGHNPNRVSCTCCGSDYAIDDAETLEELQEYHLSGRDFSTERNMLVIPASEIGDHERKGYLPKQGFVWVD